MQSPSDAQTTAVVVKYDYYIGGKLHGLMSQITEPDGGSHQYTYYANRRAFEVTDAMGHSTAMSYDLYRRRTTFTNERRADTTYEYNDDGMLVKQTNPDRTSDSYVWQDGLMQSWTDPFGNTESYEFFPDGLGNLKRTVDRSGRVTDLTYDPVFANVTSITVNPGPYQQTTQFTYDVFGSLTQVEDELGNKTTMSYAGCSNGSRGLVCARTAPNGNVPAPDADYTTTYTYNNAGQLLTSSTALPSQTSNTYDVRGNLLTSTDPTGIQTTYLYDLLGRRLTIALPDPDGSGPLGPIVTTTAYDSMARPVSVVDANGNETTYSYDSKGQLIESAHADGTSFRFEWDPTGNRGAVIDQLSRRTEWLYDARNRPIQIIHPDGTSNRSRYDAVGRSIATTDAQDNSTKTTYDPLGRALTVTDALGNTTLNSYDPFGNIDTVIDARGGVTSYVYDSANRPIMVHGPDGALRTTEYDANGNVIRLTRYDLTGLGNIVDPQALPAALQRVTQYFYDVQDRPLQTIDSLGNSNFITYDAAGRVLSRQDALGRVSSTNYDAAGRVIQLVAADPDAAGPLTAPVTDYTLDAAGNVLAVRDALGRVTTASYDPLNRVIKRYDANSFLHSFSYDVAGQLMGEQDESSRTTLYAYDDRGRQTRRILPDPDLSDGVQPGPATIWTFDVAGNLTSETDALGRVTQFESDALGRRTRQTLADSDGAGPLPAPFIASRYDAAGALVQATDQLGRTNATIYDAAGRSVLTVSHDPDGNGPLPAPSYSVTFDTLGNRIRSTDTVGRDTLYQYDALDRLIVAVEPDPDGSGPLEAPVSVTTYDAVGNVISVTDPLGHATTYQYDQLNRRIRETLSDPDGAGPQPAPHEALTYDAVGNLISSTSALNDSTQYEYDNLNRLTRVVDPRAAATSLAYDPVGNRIRVTDPNLNDTVFTFDRLNRPVRETNELGGSRVFTYDAVGNGLSVTDRNGRTRQFSYDALDRVTAEQWIENGNVVRTIATSYDSGSRVHSRSDSNSSLTFAHDMLDRPITVSNSGTPGVPAVTWSYTYDAAGNRTALDEAIAGQTAANTAYVFDNLNRMIQIQQSGNSVSPKRIDLAYDASGRMTSLTRSNDLSGTQLVAQSSYTFDSADRLTNLVHARGATNLAAYSYQYDAANRITHAASLADDDGASSYSYDAAGQLTAALHTYQQNESYSYDAAGNRANSGYETGLNNRLMSDGTYSYIYDAEGNRTRRTHIGTGDYVDYEWDHRNRLTRVTSQSAAGVVTRQVDYTYDALDRRISRTVNPDGAGPAVAWSDFFVFEDEDVALIFHDSDASGSEPPVLSSRLLHGPSVDQVLADESPIYGVLWPLADHEGTVRDLVQPSGTDTEVLNHLVYDSFGRITSETDPTVDHLFGYTGRERDEATDLLNYRARWYDPAAGRFISEDPAGFAAGDANLSRYVANNPVNAIDPSGLQVQTPVHSVPVSQFDFIDAGGRTITCVVCSDGSRSYFNLKSFADGHMESTPFGDFFIEGDATITSVEARKGMWSTYDEDLRITNRQPGLWERIGVSLARSLMPEGEPDVVVGFSDGTSLVHIGAGPSTGQLAGQALTLTGLVTAATKSGIVGLSREFAGEIIDTAIAETTGIPIPIASGLENLTTRVDTQVLRSIGRLEASTYNAANTTPLQLANDIDGVTADSSAIARHIRNNTIGVNILGERMFAKAYQLRNGTLIGVDGTLAFAYRGQMYLRRSSPAILADAVHEGKHNMDFSNDFRGTVQELERRAWFAEREFLSRLGLKPPHERSSQMLLDIQKIYDPYAGP
jgi:RHS repeat-associated protein